MPEHRGSHAIRRMIELAPFSGSLALWVDHVDAPANAQSPPIATDGKTISYGVGFDYLPPAQQMGLLAHELLHVALRHAQRFSALQDADLRLYTICADAIVNSALSHVTWLELPPSPVTLEQILAKALGLHMDADEALREWDVERLYRAIDDRQPSRSSPQVINKRLQPKRPNGGSGESEHDRQRQDGATSSRVRQIGRRVHADLLTDGKQPAPSEREAGETQQWIARLAQAERGDGLSSILRGLIHDLPHARTPWELILRTRLARALAPSPSLSWSRPSRSYIANQGRSASGLRMPYEPGRSQSKLVPRLAVIVDVSGSITEGVLRQFTREIAAISRRQEAPLALIIGDDQVRHVSVFEPGTLSFEDVAFRGGGGTDYTPLLEEADRHHPDIGVVLGDLDGPAQFRPHWPVVWAVPPQSAKAVPPFGSKLVLA